MEKFALCSLSPADNVDQVTTRLGSEERGKLTELARYFAPRAWIRTRCAFKGEKKNFLFGNEPNTYFIISEK